MKIRHSLIIAAIALISVSCSDNLRMLVGTYTEGTDSEGVYLYDFDQNSAKAVLRDVAAAGNPSFVIPSEDGTAAWSVEEFNDGRQDAVSYRMASGKIDRLNSCAIELSAGSAADPCNLLFINGILFTANYTGGTFSALSVAEDGSLEGLAALYAPEANDAQPHIHCAVASPDGKYVFITDLGCDRIFRITLGDKADPVRGMKTAYEFSGGKGPRHMIFSADGKYAYLIHELSDELTTFRYVDGELEMISTILAYDGAGHGSADIHLSPDGRHLYASHRLKEDGISIFEIQPDGTPAPVGYCKTGIHPRNFAITPNGKYLLCACRDSNYIEIYKIDRKSGLLTPTDQNIPIASPTCIQLF